MTALAFMVSASAFDFPSATQAIIIIIIFSRGLSDVGVRSKLDFVRGISRNQALTHPSVFLCKQLNIEPYSSAIPAAEVLVSQMEATPEGEDRVRATAQQIVKSLGAPENVTRDMLRILSKFDNRLSNMSPSMDRTDSAKMEENLAAADQMISKWDAPSARQSLVFQAERVEAGEYMRAVDDLQQLMEKFSVEDGSSAKLIRAQHLMQVSMSRLEKEFHHILLLHNRALASTDDLVSDGKSSSSSVDEEGGSANRPSTAGIAEAEAEAEAVGDLRGIAGRMVRAGYVRECVRVYGIVRKSAVDESLYWLGMERLAPGAVQKLDWETLEGKIKNWIGTAKAAIRTVFAGERRLCDSVFAGFGPVGESCFAEIAQGSALQLLGFAEGVAAGKRSPEKLFRVLDLYEALSELVPDIESVFSRELGAGVRSQAAGILVRLGEAARGMLAEFGNAIQKEGSKVPIPGGAIHPLERYVMNYICFLCDYKETLAGLVGDTPIDIPKALPDGLLGLIGDFERGDEWDSRTYSLSLHFAWIIVILQCRLDGKAKLYKDVALSYLFLMNNLHYIVQKVKGSELKDLLGEDWLRRHSGKVRQYATNYERAAWIKVLSCLRDEGIYVGRSFSSGVSKQALKERFKSFNAAIEEVHRVQATWIVSDVQLREELQISIAEKLIPAYRSFLGRFGKHLEDDRHSEMYMKYTAEDLESSLLDLFQGVPLSACTRRSQ